MNIWQIFHDLIFDYTLRTVALGAAALGLVSGVLGSFAVLRKQSLLGDAMSHAALPGIVLAFLLTRSKSPLVMMLGAVVVGWLAVLLILYITNSTRIKYDSALGFVLSVFFGLGLVGLTFVQRLPDARQAGLETFLFGQAAALLGRDVLAMAVLGGLALLVVGLLWKEFKLLSFDPAYATTLGLPVRGLDILLTTLLVVAIVIGLQAVGVVLMSAMVVAPAAAARQWTDRLGVMVSLAAGFGALSGVAGALLSSLVPRLPTGPTIVLAASSIVLVSFLAAPNRGLVWGWVRRAANQRRLRLDAVLLDLYALARQHDSLDHAHSLEVLQAMGDRSAGVERSLRALAEQGLVRQVEGRSWALTAPGLRQAESLLQSRTDAVEEQALFPMKEVQL
jgi:manganese/zinc/iron transport system permease protein